MTYTEVEWLNVDEPIHETIKRTFSRFFAYPIYEGDHRNLLRGAAGRPVVQLTSGRRWMPLFAVGAAENALALSMLEQFRQTGQRLALVA
jgi:hypothetical protein